MVGRVVGTFNGLRHNLYLGYALASLAMSRTYAVASRVAAAYHEHVFALGAYQLVFRILASGEHTILLCKHVERKIHAFKLSARYGKVARRRRSRGYHVCVEAFGQLANVDVLIIFKGYTSCISTSMRRSITALLSLKLGMP